MKDISILIGGRAGDGIDTAGPVIARIFKSQGYYVYLYRDYQSLIRGGHNFSLIRASKNKIGAYKNTQEIILALNQETVDIHKSRLLKKGLIIYDSDTVKSRGKGIPLTSITKQLEAPPIVRNSGLLGALCKTLGVDWKISEKVIRENTPKEIELNLKVAKKGYELAEKVFSLSRINQKSLPLFMGNETIGLGLVKAGLKSYVAYPMTPSSTLLHFLAQNSGEFGIKVFHPENEIGVIITALGMSYAGEKVAVGTSGGGFCLMSEGLSLSGMAELPVVIVVSQRPGPATGLPTHTAQGDLSFILHAGHGEFTRFVVAPGDPEECYFWAGVSLNLAWKYQTPSFILVDKNVSESMYSFNPEEAGNLKEEKYPEWDKRDSYLRYKLTKNGVSPLAFPGNSKAIVKVSSYEHDEYGITTEDSLKTVLMQDKRLRKEDYMAKELEKYKTIKIYGNKKSKKALICWGSVKGVCTEVAEKLDMKVVQILVISPFPVKKIEKALKGVNTVIDVENNATAQLAKILSQNGICINKTILKYDGRPFAVEELENNVRRIKNG